MSAAGSHKEERRRQLQAAADGLYFLNDRGRYVIRGTAWPSNRVRESLLHANLITWPSRQTGEVQITPEGRAELEGTP